MERLQFRKTAEIANSEGSGAEVRRGSFPVKALRKKRTRCKKK